MKKKDLRCCGNCFGYGDLNYDGIYYCQHTSSEYYKHNTEPWFCCDNWNSDLMIRFERKEIYNETDNT